VYYYRSNYKIYKVSGKIEEKTDITANNQYKKPHINTSSAE